MKVLVTGATGQLGYDVIRHLEMRGIPHKGVGSGDFDLTNREETMEAILAYAPDAVIHCAAYTAVDRAEDEAERARAVNGDGTRHVAEACRQLDARMVYISTDYVFNGQGTRLWEPEDSLCPVNSYGASKALGEAAVQEVLEKYFIVRISWVFGRNGHNFVKTMRRLGAEREEVRVVADQIGSPTYTWDLARLLLDMIQTDAYGIYHASNEGFCSWYEFTQEIMRQSGLNCRVTPLTSAEYPSRARRPLNSRMSKEKLVVNGFERLPSWQDALARYLKELDFQVR